MEVVKDVLKLSRHNVLESHQLTRNIAELVSSPSKTLKPTCRTSGSTRSRGEPDSVLGNIWTWKVSNASAIRASLSGHCR
jgi:hypothetical protein